MERIIWARIGKDTQGWHLTSQINELVQTVVSKLFAIDNFKTFYMILAWWLEKNPRLSFNRCENYSCFQNFSPYICCWFGSLFNCKIETIKREVRCKSGAIPVAVRSPQSASGGEFGKQFKLQCHFKMGRLLNCVSSQKTCQIKQTLFNAFGWKAEV